MPLTKNIMFKKVIKKDHIKEVIEHIPAASLMKKTEARSLNVFISTAHSSFIILTPVTQHLYCTSRQLAACHVRDRGSVIACVLTPCQNMWFHFIVRGLTHIPTQTQTEGSDNVLRRTVCIKGGWKEVTANLITTPFALKMLCMKKEKNWNRYGSIRLRTYNTPNNKCVYESDGGVLVQIGELPHKQSLICGWYEELAQCAVGEFAFGGLFIRRVALPRVCVNKKRAGERKGGCWVVTWRAYVFAAGFFVTLERKLIDHRDKRRELMAKNDARAEECRHQQTDSENINATNLSPEYLCVLSTQSPSP